MQVRDVAVSGAIPAKHMRMMSQRDLPNQSDEAPSCSHNTRTKDAAAQMGSGGDDFICRCVGIPRSCVRNLSV